MITYEQYLRNSAVSREVLDVFLDDAERSWARFDPELGYVLGNSMPRDGLDGCSTISTAHPNGARTSHVYAGRPCRINTYGASSGSTLISGTERCRRWPKSGGC